MRAARAVAVLAVTLAGFAALPLLGAGAAWAALIGAALAVAAPALRPFVGGWPWPLLTVGVAAGAGIAAWLGTPPEDALAVGLAYLQAQRRLARTGPDDDRATALLAALMLIAAASRSEHVAFLPASLVFAVATPLVLLPPLPDVRAARVLFLLPLATIGLAALLFPVLPRLDAPAPPLDDAATTGFATDVELGALGHLLDDPAEVLRVRVDRELEGPLYLRGVALDAFDGRRWWATTPSVPVQPRGVVPEAGLATLWVEGQPGAGGVLFTAGTVSSVDAPGRALRRDGAGSWSVVGPVSAPVAYAIHAGPPWGPGALTPDPGSPAPALLELPATLDPRVRALAASVAPEERDPAALAEALAQWLRARQPYARGALVDGGQTPLDIFLVEARPGHCEYFASSLAVLLRARGVPARVVNGFAGGERADDGSWVFRRYHAHSWVEVRTVEGWRLVDATPGPGPEAADPLEALADAVERWWEDQVLRWDGGAQREAAIGAGRRVERLLRLPAGASPWRGLAVLVAGCLVAALLARRGVRRVVSELAGEAVASPKGPVARSHTRARRHVADVGWRVPEALPPVEAARWLARRAPGAEAAALEQLAWLLYEVRYGGADEGQVAPRARALADRVMQLPGPRANP